MIQSKCVDYQHKVVQTKQRIAEYEDELKDKPAQPTTVKELHELQLLVDDIKGIMAGEGSF